MGVGAYGSALVSKELDWPVPLAMLIGALIAAFFAFLLSFPLFRMKGFYFLIGSFAAGEVIRLVWKWSELTWLFGGPKGIKLIPPFPDIELLSIDFYDPVNYYYLCLIVVAVSLLILYRVERSRIGLTFHAIHWQDKLAESVTIANLLSLGSSLHGYKLWLFSKLMFTLYIAPGSGSINLDKSSEKVFQIPKSIDFSAIRGTAFL
jgi:branched-chain amino acid transport system permease protein